MKKRKGLRPTRKSPKKDYTTAVASNGKAAPHIIQLGPQGAAIIAFSRMARRRGAWFREHVRKRMIGYSAGVAVAVTAYGPWLIDYAARERLQQLEPAIAASEFYLGLADCGYLQGQIDYAAFSEIRLVGDHSLARRPLGVLPVVYEDEQIELRNHPVVVRSFSRDCHNIRLAGGVVAAIKAEMYESKRRAPHSYLVDLFQPLPADPLPQQGEDTYQVAYEEGMTP